MYIVPGDPSVNGGSLTEGIGDLLATRRRVNGNNGRRVLVALILVAALYSERQRTVVMMGCVVGGEVGIGDELARRLNGGLSLEGRVVYLGARVGGEGLEPSKVLEILMVVGVAVVCGGGGVVVLVGVVDVSE